MPRIAGTNIPENKRILIALTYIYGVGASLSKKVLEEIGVDFNKKSSKLSTEEINKIRDILEKKHVIEGELKRKRMMDIKRLKDIGCYKGVRHIKKLPARGQRTKKNSRTVRGNVRRTVGSGKKPPPTPK